MNKMLTEEQIMDATIKIAEQVVEVSPDLMKTIPLEYHQAVIELLQRGVVGGMGYAQGFADGVDAELAQKH